MPLDPAILIRGVSISMTEISNWIRLFFISTRELSNWIRNLCI